MPIQPEPILRGAVRWLERIPSSGVARTRSLLVTNPRFADLTPTQYETALEWIHRVGLLHEASEGCRTPREAVFEAAVTEAVWFRDLDILVTSPDELPADATAALDGLGLTDAEGFRLAGRQWGKVDTEQRERVGALGEELLVNLLRRSVIGTVEHVSLITDAAGFDVLVRTPTTELHLEVKTSVRRNRTTFHLSRNEYEVMRTDRRWVLVHLTLDASDRIERIRTVEQAFISHAVPADTGVYGRWQSCSIDAPPECLRLGIPHLQASLVPDASRLLA